MKTGKRRELRIGAIQQFKSVLDNGVLSQHNFTASFNNSDGTLVAVVFNDNEQFYFKILHPESDVNSKKQWKTLEAPGQFFTSEEEYEHRDFNTAHSRASSWISRLVEEIAQGNDDNGHWLAQLRQNLEATAENLPEPNIPFSESEVEGWSAKFGELVTRLQELEEENKIQNGVVRNLRIKLDELEKKGSVMPKRTWLKTSGHKILDVFEHGAKSGLEALAKGAVQALLNGK